MSNLVAGCDFCAIGAGQVEDVLFRLHVHVVPRFDDDHFAMPDPAVSELPRDERLRQADGLGRALSAPG
jgi:diadenosine tetraphosphate (Ap4A) HIT family hydrolase